MTAPGPPRRGTERSRRVATRILGWFGWRIAGVFPTAPRAVMIVAPHTSNLDFYVCMLAMFATGLRVTWIAKHTLFFWPAAPVSGPIWMLVPAVVPDPAASSTNPLSEPPLLAGITVPKADAIVKLLPS